MHAGGDCRIGPARTCQPRCSSASGRDAAGALVEQRDGRYRRGNWWRAACVGWSWRAARRRGRWCQAPWRAKPAASARRSILACPGRIAERGTTQPPLKLALKSGNFGAPDFFLKAFAGQRDRKRTPRCVALEKGAAGATGPGPGYENAMSRRFVTAPFSFWPMALSVAASARSASEGSGVESIIGGARSLARLARPRPSSAPPSSPLTSFTAAFFGALSSSAAASSWLAAFLAAFFGAAFLAAFFFGAAFLATFLAAFFGAAFLAAFFSVQPFWQPFSVRPSWRLSSSALPSSPSAVTARIAIDCTSGRSSMDFVVAHVVELLIEALDCRGDRCGRAVGERPLRRPVPSHVCGRHRSPRADQLHRDGRPARRGARCGDASPKHTAREVLNVAAAPPCPPAFMLDVLPMQNVPRRCRCAAMSSASSLVVPIPRLRTVLGRLLSISTRLRSMDRPSVFRAAHVDRVAMLGANRARANLFRYSASAVARVNKKQTVSA